jgi:uncharacterized protein (DUF952 family)
MDAAYVYHMCPAAAWLGKEDEQYFPPTFERDTFIHCSPNVDDQLLDIANHFYRSSEGDWIVLTIDVSKLKSEVRWEQPMAVGDIETELADTELMPHIYGTIDRDAATVTHRLVRDPSGSFLRIEGV